GAPDLLARFVEAAAGLALLRTGRGERLFRLAQPGAGGPVVALRLRLGGLLRPRARDAVCEKRAEAARLELIHEPAGAQLGGGLVPCVRELLRREGVEPVGDLVSRHARARRRARPCSSASGPGCPASSRARTAPRATGRRARCGRRSCSSP